jgi:peroxiredoxin
VAEIIVEMIHLSTTILGSHTNNFRQLFLSDSDCKFSEQYGWAAGGRTARYAIVIDHGKITYAEKEPGREVTVSSAEAVLAKL